MSVSREIVLKLHIKDQAWIDSHKACSDQQLAEDFIDYLLCEYGRRGYVANFSIERISQYHDGQQ